MFKDALDESLTALKHEELTRNKVKEDPDLGKILKRHFLPNADALSELSIGQHENTTLSKIISGPLDADKIDYIQRDNHHCGFPVGIDIDTLSQVLTRDQRGALAISSHGRSFAEQLVIARYHLITNIWHNSRNRLANYLMALALQDAMNPSNVSKFRDIYTKGTDSDLMAFLEEYSPPYNDLRLFLDTGTGFVELGNFDFQILPPTLRYAVSLIAENREYMPKINNYLKSKMRLSDVFAECYYAKLPEVQIDLLAEIEPKLLMDLPLVKGVVRASAMATSLSIYVRSDTGQQQLTLEKVVPLAMEQDRKLTIERAREFAREFRDDTEYAAYWACQVAVIEAAKELHGQRVSFSDLLLLTVAALDRTFAEKCNREHTFFDGVTALAETLLASADKDFVQSNERDLILRHVRRDPSTPLRLLFEPEFLMALEKLEVFGLVYRLVRARKFRKFFKDMHVIRCSSWGHKYYGSILSRSNIGQRLYNGLCQYFGGVVIDHRQDYESYLNALKEHRQSDELKGLRQALPVKVI